MLNCRFNCDNINPIIIIHGSNNCIQPQLYNIHKIK